MSRRRPWIFFFLCLFVYNANLRFTGSFDSLAGGRLPFRILTGHGLTFDDPSTTVPENVRYSYTKNLNGQWICLYPILTPLILTPLYVPAVLLERSRPYLDPRGIELAMEKLSASLVTALSVVFLFLTLRRLTSEKLATWLSAAYAFGTSTWSISSQALWSHAMGELLLVLALYWLARGAESPVQIALLGAVAGLLAANRPTDLIFGVALAGIVVHDRGKRAWPFFLAAASIGAILVAYNLTEFGALAGGYARFPFPNARPFGLGRLGVSGLVGLLFSNRGIFFFSPFTLLFFFRSWRKPEPIRGLRFLLAAYLGSLFLYGLAFDWMGGYCYGPRYAIHGLPVLIVALVEPLERIWKIAVAKIAFAAAVAFSIALQAIGAFFYPNGDSGEWHHGLWTIRNSSPMLALRAGPAMPHFLFLLAPGTATRFPLPPDAEKCRLEWAAAPPSELVAGRPVTLHVRVTNLGTSRWSSVGGFFNSGGVEIQTAWRSPDRSSLLGESSSWLAWKLDPRRSLEREVHAVTPPAPGPQRLELELEQDRMGPFPSSLCPALQTNVRVIGAEVSSDPRRP